MFAPAPIKAKLTSGGPTGTGVCSGRTFQGSFRLTLQMPQSPNVETWASAATKTLLPEGPKVTSCLQHWAIVTQPTPSFLSCTKVTRLLTMCG